MLLYNIKNPLDQFEIRELLTINGPLLLNIHISLINISLYIIITTLIIFNLNIINSNLNKIVPYSWSTVKETIYATIYSIIVNQINEKKGQFYFPLIFSLFIYILVNNLISMIPYSFASTSHFVLTFSLSFTIVGASTILGFKKHGFNIFSLFVPSGCPLALLPLLVVIEFISYLARNVSLGLRLAANILSGHMLLNILSGFTFNIMNMGLFFFFLAFLPLLFIIAFSGLELAISFIQAQVFVVLSCSYIKDALDLH